MNRSPSDVLMVAAVLAGLAVLACDRSRESAVTAPTVPRYLETAEVTTPCVWARQVQGVAESGALYAMFLPDRWNGRLEIFIHGLVDPARPIVLPTLGAAADTLRAHCYALAYSSFAENGWAVKDGAQRTHELSDLFAAEFGEPRRTYLYGQSMGGLIALKLAESYPTQYDGVLDECGVLGMPEWIDLVNGIRLPARAAMVARPDGAHNLAAIEQNPVPFSSESELI